MTDYLTYIIIGIVIAYGGFTVFKRTRSLVRTAKHIFKGPRVHPDSKLSPEETRKISVGSLYAYQQGGWLDSVELDVDSERLRTVLSEWWSIDNRKDAVDTLNYLMSMPSQRLFPLVVKVYHLTDKKEIKRIISEAVEGDKELIEKVTDQAANLRIVEDEYARCGIIPAPGQFAPQGTLGWDAGRLNFIARACYEKKYISLEECKQCLDIAYQMIIDAEFKTWKEFSNSYVLGRGVWSGNTDMEAMAGDLFKNANLPWVKYPLEQATTQPSSKQ